MKVSIFLLVLFILSFLSPMNFKHKIIQWNCRGLKPKFDEISIILEQQKPSFFCLQETFLKPNDNVTLKGFNITIFILTAKDLLAVALSLLNLLVLNEI